MNKTTEKQLKKAIKKIIVEEIIDGLLNGGEYNISGFGKFKIKKRKAQKIKNPIIGEGKINEVFVIKFLPSRKLKKYINQKLKIKGGGNL